jgi:hypothetical protein
VLQRHVPPAGLRDDDIDGYDSDGGRIFEGAVKYGDCDGDCEAAGLFGVFHSAEEKTRLGPEAAAVFGNDLCG